MIKHKTGNNMSSSGLTRGSRNGVESGRSMVEMLGVLAVVGVLSVGSIAGYTYAMNKHYANELLAGASERAVLVTAQIASGRKPSLKEFANHTTAGGTFATEDERVRVYSDGIGIEVSGVKGAVCKNLIKDTEDTDIIIVDTNDAELTEDGCKEENTLIITFETGIGGASDSGANETVCDPACEDGEKCINDTCVPFVSECENIEGEGEDVLTTCTQFCGTYDGERYCHTVPEDCSPYEECYESEEIGGQECYTTVPEGCQEFCITNDESCAELGDKCVQNSDCNDWCQDKNEPCFCQYGGYNGVKTGRCAVATQLAEDECISGACSEENMNWLSAKNFCQAHGWGMWHVEADTSEGEIVNHSLKERAQQYGGRWLVINDGEPSRIDFSYMQKVDVLNNTGRAACAD